MDGSFRGKLRVWPPAPAVVQNLLAAPAHPALAGPHGPAEFAARLFAHETLDPAAPRPRTDEGAEPYSLQWFLSIESRRHSRHGRWIPRLLEFGKHGGESLLGLGNGLGTDWLQYARHGAAVVVCSPSAAQLSLIRRNFELRDLPGRFHHAPPTALPLESASVDVACVTDLLQEVERPEAVVGEVYRVLKPGGKVLAVVPAKYDADFWYNTCFWWQRLLGLKLRPLDPRVARFSRRRLKRLFGRFVEPRVHKRQVRRRELPHLWRWLPLPVLERLFGHLLVIKAFKPLSAALPPAAAA